MTQHTAPAPAEPTPASAQPPGEPHSPADPTFTSPRLPLDRLSTVRDHTVVAVFDGSRPPSLRGPGELLIPAWTPWQRGLEAIVVTTGPVTLRVRVDSLLTLDGEDMALVELDVVVRLQESEVARLVAELGNDLGPALTAEVRQSVQASVRNAVGRTRASELRRHPLTPVLRDRWLPETFAEGALLLEDVTVRELRWSLVEEPVSVPDDDTADLEPIVVVDTSAPLTLGRLGREDRHQQHRSTAAALEHVYLPAVLSVGAAWIFFIAYWLPELQTLPGARFLLEQLAPLGWMAAVGHPAAGSGDSGHPGAAAAILLVAGLLLAPLARSRFWLARLALWPLSYVAAVTAAVAVLGVASRGRLASELLGVALLVVWVVAALVTTWRSLWVDVDALPRRPGGVAWLLAAFALLTPAPIALGRSVFAPELRDAALGVMGNDAALRWSALLTPATAWVYLSGLLLGVLAWAGYVLWPPRRADRASRPVAALAAGLLALLVVAPQASQAATRQAETMRTQSPKDRLSFSCGAWTVRPVGAPVRTLISSGLSCQRLTALVGYQELSSRDVASSLSPVHAQTVAGRRIPGRLVTAQYGGVVVVGASDRLDRRLTALHGLRVADGVELWRYPCPATRTVRIRFAGASGGDDGELGRQTGKGERPAILVDCGRGLVAVNPRTGRPG